MKNYLDIVSNILSYGESKNNRTGIPTLVVPNQIFSHDMNTGFPLLTTKQIATKTMAVELEGFIKGVTSKSWFKNRGCNIWNEWANPVAIQRKLDNTYYNETFLKDKDFKKRAQEDEDDLGPLGYSWQWRRFNQVYDEDDDGGLNGYDQFAHIVNTLKTNPNDRRMVCSAWNPVQLHLMALPPCTFAWVLTHVNGTLHMSWVQRSCDVMIGLPFDIAHHALLLTLLCKVGDFIPGNLTGLLCDCHIYENHILGAREQLKRTPSILPTISIDYPNKQFDIFNWTHKDWTIHNYKPQNKIKFKIAV